MKYQNIKVDELIFKPSSEFVKTNIYELEFSGVKNSPNVYVVKSTDNINSKFISFTHNNISYNLNDVVQHNKGEFIFLECRTWEEHY